jgi:DNA-binding IclR family transcriptional regulator
MSAIQKGFQILQVITAAPEGLSFSEVVAGTDVPKATAHRLLKELVGLTALTQNPATRRYQGGLLLARLGAAVTADYDLRRVARPHLQAMHDETLQVATLGIRNDDEGTYLDKIEARDFGLRLHSEIGKSFPLHCTAMGKVMLSHAGTDTIRRLTNRKLDSYTENTITDGRQLRAELKQVSAAGYAVDREEITRGLICIAAPVYGVDGNMAGAMSCTFPSYLFADKSMEPEIQSVVRHASAASGSAVSSA